MRSCRKSGCSGQAAAMCSFNYSARQIWITPLRDDPDPASYDLCDEHATRFVAPIGWMIQDLRHSPEPAGTLGV